MLYKKRGKFTNAVVKLNLKHSILHIVALFAILIYLSCHAFSGSRGVISYFKLQGQLKESYLELEKLRLERIRVEHQVKLLSSNSLDLDMLDEKVRQVLDMASPNEQIFVHDKNLK